MCRAPVGEGAKRRRGGEEVNAGRRACFHSLAAQAGAVLRSSSQRTGARQKTGTDLVEEAAHAPAPSDAAPAPGEGVSGQRIMAPGVDRLVHRLVAEPLEIGPALLALARGEVIVLVDQQP